MIKKLIVASFILLSTSLANAQTLGTTTPIPEGTCVAGTSSIDLICARADDHVLATSFNNSTYQNLLQTFRITTDYTNATTAFTSVTGLSFPVAASRNYHAVCHIIWNASAASAGPNYQFTGPILFTTVQTSVLSAVTASSFFTLTANTFQSRMNNSNTVFTNTNMIDTITFDFQNGTIAGTVQLQASAANTGTLTIRSGSACQVQ